LVPFFMELFLEYSSWLFISKE